MIEALAEYAHSAWSGWMIYMFAKCKYKRNGTLVIPKWAVDRWTRQMKIQYPDLPESEKGSDRKEAGVMIDIFNRYKDGQVDVGG
ncbi:hypothetical protein LCGC14_1615390 [marine sediment metagenome]|uniref:Uncharacterized protein n=1 Tax=marine sediment metagenome TaxID=412755 RepID=A0A0F9KMJ1_9ZZZZ